MTLFPVLLVADLFHPVDDLAVEPLLNGDVRQGGARNGAASASSGAETRPHHRAISSAFALSPAAFRGHNERLPERVRMPCGSCTRFERHVSGLHELRIRRRFNRKVVFTRRDMWTFR